MLKPERFLQNCQACFGRCEYQWVKHRAVIDRERGVYMLEYVAAGMPPIKFPACQLLDRDDNGVLSNIILGVELQASSRNVQTYLTSEKYSVI